MAHITITLHVDTEKIKQEKIDKHCTFSDNFHVEGRRESSEDFTTTLNIGDIVTWNALPEDPTKGAAVVITEVFYEQIPGSTNLFGVNPLTGVNGMVTGTVQGHPGEKTKYTVKFDVKKGDVTKHFIIDPKIETKD